MMDVLFLRNPDTGEVRRFFAKASIPHDASETFGGWEVVDGFAWADANADKAVVDAAVARYHELTPPAAETDARGDVLPSAFAQAAQGDDALAVALYEAATLRTELASVRSQLAAAEAANERLANALEPFAEAWLQVPLGVESRLWIDRYVEGAKIGTESLGISTDTLQDAHTAWAGLPEATGGSGEGAGE